MVIIGMMSYPPEQSKKIGKRFIGNPPLPEYIKMKGPYLTGEIGGGIKSIIIYEFDQTKTREAIEAISKRYTNYIGVPGLTYSVNVCSKLMKL